MEIVLKLRFQDVFPDEKIPELEELLQNVPSNVALNVICFINSKIFINQLNLQTQSKIFLTLIERMPQETQEEIINNFNSFIARSPKDQLSLINVFSLIGLLRFVEYEILNYRPGEYGNITAEDELNVLKAILIFNEKIDSEFSNIIKQTPKGPYQYPNELFYRTVWPNLIRQFEFTYFKNILKQLYLSMLFFEYLHVHEVFKIYFESYLAKSKITQFKDYSKKLVELIINSYKMGKGEYHSSFKPDLIEKNSVIQEFIIEPHKIDRDAYLASKHNLNFKVLRKKPIIRFEDGHFAIINWNFITDKLFQAFVFDFYNNSGVNEKYSFDDFKSDIGDQFAHQVVFENIMDKIFMGKGICLKNQGDLINFDYYFRKGNKIVIFEFKDLLLKYNEEYDEIIKDIDRKMVYEVRKGKTSKKAVFQLMEHVNKIHDRFKEIDDFVLEGIDKSRIIIYPVIVYTHEMWGIPGINDYLAERFAIEYRKKKYRFFMVRDLIMMDFDHFLDCYDSLREGCLDIFQLLEKYYADISLHRAFAQKTGSSKDRIKTFRTFEEAVSQLKHKKCRFMGNSLYNEISEKLEIPNG